MVHQGEEDDESQEAGSCFPRIWAMHLRSVHVQHSRSREEDEEEYDKDHDLGHGLV